MLFSYGIISSEDMRIDFGAADFGEMPEPDSDLEKEVFKVNIHTHLNLTIETTCLRPENRKEKSRHRPQIRRHRRPGRCLTTPNLHRLPGHPKTGWAQQLGQPGQKWPTIRL